MARAVITVTAIFLFISTLQNLGAASPTKVCSTTACNYAADRMLKLMDQSVEPCQDFNQYACGSFLKNRPILNSTVWGVGSFADAGEKNKKLFQKILEEPIVRDGPNSFEKKMKTLYKACLDVDAIEAHGLKDYKDGYKEDWPTLDDCWDEESYSLQDLTDKYLKMFTGVLFSLSLTIDTLSTEDRYILQVAEPKLLLSRPEFKEEKKLFAYQKYYTDFAMALGATKDNAEKDAKDVTEFSTMLGKNLLERQYYYDPEKIINPSTLDKMNCDYGYLDWVKSVQSIYDAMNITVKASQKVNIRNPEFLKGLNEAINNATRRTIQNFFGFTYALKIVGGATKQMRDIRFEFDKVVKDKKEQVPRKEYCIKTLDAVYNVGLAKLMSKSMYSEEARSFMKTMIENIKESLKQNIHNSTWMEQSTKAEALLKIKTLKEKIGVQSEKFENTDLDDLYSKFVVSKNNYNADLLQNWKEKKVLHLKDLDQPLKNWRWDDSMTEVNAGFMAWKNEIYFPLGILQDPFFNQNNPSYMNYGAIGAFIGHEIGHAFDSHGRQYDSRGRLRDWWTPKDAEKYNDQTQCIIDQYSTYEVTELNRTVNGNQSKSENAADVVGSLTAYRAYKEKASHDKEQELPLPKLELDNDQLFFLSMAQLWCLKYTPDLLKKMVEQWRYAPPSKRLMGMMRNSQSFADAFNCKPTDYMNPAEKCTLIA